jgi:hypothetical protein
MVPGSAWGRAVEKVVSRQKALNDRAGARRSSERTSALETSALEKKLRSEDQPAGKQPSTARTTDLVGELNWIWDDPVPAESRLKRRRPPLAR